MKSLVAIFALVGVLSFWAGAAVAKPVELSCGSTKCTFPEELGPEQTKVFHGHCDSSTPMTTSNSGMICHKAQGVTCEKAKLIHPKGSDRYWSCSCSHVGYYDANTTIDMTCP